MLHSRQRHPIYFCFYKLLNGRDREKKGRKGRIEESDREEGKRKRELQRKKERYL